MFLILEWCGVIGALVVVLSQLGKVVLREFDETSKDSDQPSVVVLVFAAALMVGSLWLLGINLLDFLVKHWPFLAGGMVAYLVIGAIYVYVYRAPVAVARYIEKKTRLLNERLESEQIDRRRDFDAETFKAQFKEHYRLKVSNHLGWLTTATLLWLPDFAYRSLFRFWWDLVKGFWTACAKNLQARFDKQWDQL